ncbi:TetR/AcrR family transcriptional regulator [Streptomyces sp. H10-C2]|uniref:TetR/AcrR family transcriptional regulator n=1 Tax=unclassified Streptomyces TaxID=2593676 RepID=UPI0024B994E2|nr:MULTISPECIES: TetR/AcrR family transcriptional regulator [unclassified Streptomyces]MDJ0340353.1 TetR/AcrR family transcriptional regulator [Streptomyces sp. PH10-H1]MDJ0368199.1 TetR/AcrR family transcriptional regulator [Streptomyces sp. H10-C2]
MADGEDLRDQFIEAALRVIAEHGPAGLTVRRVAEAAGSSTMGVYSRFGSRTGMLEALYERAFVMLRDAFATVPATGEALTDVRGLAQAYRLFALRSPTRYAFMFERAVPTFDPGPDLRARALESTFGVLAAAVARAADPAADPDAADRNAYLMWAAMHGMVSIELTHRDRTELPGWSIASDWEGVYLDGVHALWNGLGLGR